MSTVAEFERVFADYVGAKHAIALCNGTATLHTALAVLKPGDPHENPGTVTVPPLTMSSTSIAALHAGYVPRFVDIERDTWLMKWDRNYMGLGVPVNLYGLNAVGWPWGTNVVDAAQTLGTHVRYAAFTSYSFQASKILHLGEGGMLVTNDERLAIRAREFSSLGYRMGANEPRILKNALKRPNYARHHSLGWNYRMAPLVAEAGLRWLTGVPNVGLEPPIERAKAERLACAALYRDAIDGCAWITPQHVPDGWTHDYWCYAVALEHADLWHPFVDAIERHGGERPYAAWRLTYQEPAFRHLAEDGTCPVAEDLQPRLVQFQTNDIECAKRNAAAVDAAVYELNGVPA